MVECELCGKKATKKAKIEGAVLEVCGDCAKSGEEIFQATKPAKKIPAKLPEELNLAFLENFHFLVKKARESKRLSQESLAKKVAEKVSLIKRIEDGWEPPLPSARKLERFLDIKLIETSPTSSKAVAQKKKTDKKDLTIGDIISVKN